MAEVVYELSSELVQLIQTIESTTDANIRSNALNSFCKIRCDDSSRLLIDLWKNVKWREIKKEIILALGKIGSDRAINFLIKMASNRNDLVMASEAVLSLGNAQSMMGGEFLKRIAKTSEHPLRKESIIALANMRFLKFSPIYQSILRNEIHQQTLIQYTILAISKMADTETWRDVENHLQKYLQMAPAILNSTLLAAAKLGSEKSITVLESFPTKFRFFVDDLKNDAIERIKQKKNKYIEDEISELIQIEDEFELYNILFRIRKFGSEAVWEAYTIFKKGEDCNKEAIIRSQLICENRIEDDKDFLRNKWQQISPKYFAILFCNLKDLESFQKFDLKDILSESYFLDVVQYIGDKQFVMQLFDKLTQKDHKEDQKILIINRIVSQSLIEFEDKDFVEKVCEKLLKCFHKIEDLKTKERILRALGQLEYAHDDFNMVLNNALKDNTISSSSIYATLAQLATEEAVKIIYRRLKLIHGKKECAEEVDQALLALANIEILPVEFEYKVRVNKGNTKAILSICSKTKCEHYNSHILKHLDSANYSYQMLAISAVKYNYDEEILAKLFTLLANENTSIKQRVIDSLCYVDQFTIYRNLIDWMTENTNDCNSIEAILKKMRPKKIDSVDGLVKRLSELNKNKVGVFAEAEIRQLVNELKDYLQIHFSKVSVSRPTQGISSQLDSHEFDGELEKNLPQFPQLSETIKTILRNAELTWQHPELFNELVDKSTIIIEFTKSIDILLQEKIGTYIFSNVDQQLATKMQSRIVSLNLTDRSIPSSQRMRDLMCSQYFTDDDFPLHKLISLSESIETGKIFHDQYNVIDGLRAWCLIVLIFGRNFKWQSITYNSMLPIVQQNFKKINDLCFKLNDLQNIRNRAAHRGTLTENKQIEKVRIYSFEILNDLISIVL